jgi:hypothetical protein
LKLNADGSVDWQNTYGGDGYCIQEVSTGGYIVTGSCSLSDGGYGPKLWVLKLNADGSIDWEKTYNGPGEYDCGHWIQEVSTGGFIVTGVTDGIYESPCQTAGGSGDLWVLKLGPDGTLGWERSYGLQGWGYSDYGAFVQQVSTGGYIVAGSSASFGANAGSGEVWVLKIDESSGSELLCPLGTRRLPWVNVYDVLSRTAEPSSETAENTDITPSDTTIPASDTLAQTLTGCGPAFIAVMELRDDQQVLRVYDYPPREGRIENMDDKKRPFLADARRFGNVNKDNRRIDLAGVDIDGDGIDEIAVISQRLNGRQALQVYNPPIVWRDKISPAIASDSTFGNANKTSKRTHLAGVDIDGDGIDEIAVIEESLMGRQKLKIFHVPTTPGGETGSWIASDETFGNVNKNSRKIDLAGVDIDGDGIDEIAVIQQALDGRQALKIFRAPTTTGGETGPCLVSYNRFGNVHKTNEKIALTNIDIEDDGIDEIAVINKTLKGMLRFEVFEAPTSLNQNMDSALLTVGKFGRDRQPTNNWIQLNYVAITSLDS